MESDTKIIVTVPRLVKDRAKKYGAVFDKESRNWYIPDDCKYKKLFEPIELYVEYSNKEQAKNDGCFYNKNTKKWYALRMQKEAIEKYT